MSAAADNEEANSNEVVEPSEDGNSEVVNDRAQPDNLGAHVTTDQDLESLSRHLSQTTPENEGITETQTSWDKEEHLMSGEAITPDKSLSQDRDHDLAQDEGHGELLDEINDSSVVGEVVEDTVKRPPEALDVAHKSPTTSSEVEKGQNNGDPSPKASSATEASIPGAFAVGGTSSPDDEEMQGTQVDQLASDETANHSKSQPIGDDSMLVPASLVPDEPTIGEQSVFPHSILGMPLEDNTDVREREEQIKSLQSSRRRYVLIGLLLLAISVVVVVVVVVVLVSGGGGEIETKSPTQSPTVLTDRTTQIMSLLKTISSPEELSSVGSPQNRAMRWISEEDSLEIDPRSVPADRILQRYSLAVLYYATGGNSSWVDQFNFLSPTAECEWNSVAIAGCDDQGYVIGLDLSK